MGGVAVTGASSWYAMIRLLFRYRRTLLAVTRLEFARRFSGSVFGTAWLFLYPLLLLSIYLFVYVVIFKVRFSGYSEMDYVLYVFCGLIPYMAFSEALTTGAVGIKQNIHLVKNVMLPIELIPARAVAISVASQLVSMLLLVGLLLVQGELSWLVVFVPLVLALQVAFLIGLVLILSALVVALPDTVYFVNLGVMFLMFVSPIGFKLDMVPTSLRGLVYLNPIYYMTETFRTILLFNHASRVGPLAMYAVMCVVVFAVGTAFFRKFKGFLADYE